MTTRAELIADVYRTASLRGADMARAMPVIEALRAVLLPEGDDAAAIDRGFAASELLWRQIAASDDPGLIAAYGELRTGLRALLRDADRRRIRDGFASGAEAGWAVWLGAFGTALGYFEMRHCVMLAGELAVLARELPDRAAAPPERVVAASAAAQDMADEQWERTEAVFCMIGDAAEVDHTHRCKAWLSAAQIRIFLHKDLERAAAHIAAARAVQFDARVAKVTGELHLARREPEQARGCFEDALRLAPDRADGSLGMARLRIDDAVGRDLESAEQWSRQALQYRTGGDAYELLIEIAVKRRDPAPVIDALVDRVIRAEPERRARLWSFTCRWHADEKQFEPALRYAERLVADPQGDRHANLVLRGYLRCKTLEYAGALDDLFAALRDQPGDGDACAWLHNVALQLVERDGELGPGKQVLDEILRIVGASYEPQYRDQLQRLVDALAVARNAAGNRAFKAGHHRAAIALYEQAIALAPDPVYHANLAGAWKQIDDAPALEALEHAIAAISAAARLAPDNAEYRSRLSQLEAQRPLVQRFGLPLRRTPEVNPVGIDVAGDIGEQVGGSDGGVAALPARLLSNLRAAVFASYGVRVPGVHVRASELPASNYAVLVGEVPIALGALRLDRAWASAGAEDLARLGVTGEPASHPRGGAASWIAEADRAAVAGAGFAVAAPLEYLMMHVQAVLEANLAQFVGVQDVHNLLDEAGVAAASERPGALAAFAQVLRGLVIEQVPITALRALWAGFEPAWQRGEPAPAIVEQLRGLAEVKPALPANRDRRDHYVLGDAATAALRRSIDRGGAVPVLALEPELCQELLTAVRNGVATGSAAVLVCDPEVRPFLRKLVEIEFPGLPVIASSELVATAAHPASVIDLAERRAHG